jgi:hypothetical protein
MSKPIVLFLIGKARSGKDTFAEISKRLISADKTNLKPSVVTLAFADFLKSISVRNHNYKNKENDRDILIRVGDLFREHDLNFFAKPITEAIRVYGLTEVEIVIVTDTRLKSEYDYVVNNAECIPYVVELKGEFSSRGVSDFAKTHPTENTTIKPDLVLSMPLITPENEGDVDIFMIDVLNKIHAELRN